MDVIKKKKKRKYKQKDGKEKARFLKQTNTPIT